MSGVVTASLPLDPTPRRHEEDDLQHSVVQYLRWALPNDAIYFHIPNGGQRHKKAAARLVGLGLRAGIPDLQIIHRGACIFIELKSARGTRSAVQRQMHNRLSCCGAVVLVCRSVECVEESLRELGVPLLATVSGWHSERLA